MDFQVLRIIHAVLVHWLPQVCNWLQHVNTSLEQLTLVDANRAKPQPKKLLHLTECKKLQWLNLCYGFIPEMPSSPGRFEQLVTLHLDMIFIYDSALETLVELSPMLEDLKLNSCKGLRTPHLTALKLSSLEFANDMDVATAPITVVTVNAPNLVSVSLCQVEELVMDGFSLQSLDLLWHVRPSFRELPVLEYLHISGESWALDSVTNLIRLGTNLRSLHIDAFFERKYPIQLQSLLRHLQELVSIHIGADFFEVCTELYTLTWAVVNSDFFFNSERYRIVSIILLEIQDIDCHFVYFLHSGVLLVTLV